MIEEKYKGSHIWVLYLCYLLTARYQQDYDDQRSQTVAQRYYYQSMALIPEIGNNSHF